MQRLGEWTRRMWYLLNRSRSEAVLREEMLAHREAMSEPARFGNVLRLREEAGDVWGWGWLDDLVRDVRYALGTLRHAPGFAATTTLSLALATGATTAIFSLVNGVVLRPLPFDQPDRLVQVYGREWREDRGGTPDPLRGPLGSEELDTYQTQSTTIEGPAAYSLTTAHVVTGAGTERLTAVDVERPLFDILGVSAAIGRTFRADDGPDVAVISAGLWERAYHRDPAITGRAVTLNGRPFTIVGVMPAVFQFPYAAGGTLATAVPESRTDVWLPMPPARGGSDGTLRRGRTSAVARLRPGVSMAAATAELAVLAARVESRIRQSGSGAAARIGVRLEPLSDVVLGPVRRSLWMLFAAVGLVLAAACANVANLLLARMTMRVREVVTRAALGASHRRLFRQFLAESLLLTLLGGVMGVFVARWGVRLLTALVSTRIPRAHEVSLDWPAFAFLLVTCVATALVFGLAPAMAASRVDLQSVTRETGAATVTGRFGRLRDALVVAEIALAFILAVSAATIIAEMRRLERSDPGMDARRVLTLHLTPRAPAAEYALIEQRAAAVPGVVSAGLIQLIPLQSWGWVADFSVKGRPPGPERMRADLRYVTPGYFRTLRIPTLRGRTFTDQDVEGALRVIVVNDTLARRYFPAEDPVGRELDRGTIVGVIGDVRQAGLDVPPEPEIYYPAAQNVTMTADGGMSLLVKTTGDPLASVEAVRTAVREIDPRLAIFNIRTMEQVVSDSLWELSLYRWLIGAFATLALVLAAIGLHGVISYGATARLREFAVRLALGSERGDIARLVIARSLRLAAAGLAGGGAAALLIAQTARLLPIHATAGPAVYLSAVAVLVAIALLASLTPALRVLRVNPATALRHE